MTGDSYVIMCHQLPHTSDTLSTNRHTRLSACAVNARRAKSKEIHPPGLGLTHSGFSPWLHGQFCFCKPNSTASTLHSSAQSAAHARHSCHNIPHPFGYVPILQEEGRRRFRPSERRGLKRISRIRQETVICDVVRHLGRIHYCPYGRSNCVSSSNSAKLFPLLYNPDSCHITVRATFLQL